MKALLILLFIGLLWVSCSEEKVEPYRGSDSYVYFLDGSKMQLGDSMYTYKGSGANLNVMVGNNSYKKRDTALYRVGLSGYISDQPRTFRLEQYVPGKEDENDAGAGVAEAGVNYVAFDDPEMLEHLVIPADSIAVNVPIVILTDPNSSSGDKVLYFRLVENENFKLPAVSTNTGLYRGRIRIRQNL